MSKGSVFQTNILKICSLPSNMLNCISDELPPFCLMLQTVSYAVLKYFPSPFSSTEVFLLRFLAFFPILLIIFVIFQVCRPCDRGQKAQETCSRDNVVHKMPSS
jgi:hypothetical protein